MSHSSTTTIKYYFKDLSRNGQVSWNDYLSEEEEIEFKNAFADSIKKWNNIYVYRLNNGYYEKIKLVNIVEGNENNSNLFIWPGNSGDLAITTPSPTSSPDDEMLETKNDIIHLHINIWDTIINLDDYKNNLINNLENKTKVFERLGAHELGHLLGLSDIDYTENHINGELYHHEEVLMGYSNTKTDISINSNRQTEITYKDIIGAAITRGYHNDNNHKWLCDEQLYEGNYKLICKLCNGVKYINTLSEINYDLYKSCNNNHDLEDGNMIPVACYGNMDYYKCNYCRYVAPFTDIVQQNYIPDSNYNNVYHYIVNNVSGLSYRMLQSHNYQYNSNSVDCAYCNYSVSMDEIMITDPDQWTNCGSEVNLNDGVYRGNTITQGFTRLIYFGTSFAPSISRLDYEWTSSNTNVATVSQYGTVTALSVDEPTWVTITAQYKYGNITLNKELLILPDSSNELMIINYVVEMDVGESYVFNLDDRAPTTSIQNYTWNIPCQEDESAGVRISQWGTITATSAGTMYINGYYNLNSNVIITIKVIVR